MTTYPPMLLEWMTVSQAAAELGLSRQAVNKMIDQRKFKSVRTLSAEGTRPMYVIRSSEIKGMSRQRQRSREQKVEETA